MARETSEVLEEIATLLRQYVEYTGQMQKRAEERLTKLTRPKMDFTRDIKAVEAKHAVAAEKHRAEEGAFRSRLLDLLERHNKMLGEVLKSQRSQTVRKARKTRHRRTK